MTLDITISKYKTADRNLCIGISAAIVVAACVAAVVAVRKKKLPKGTTFLEYDELS